MEQSAGNSRLITRSSELMIQFWWHCLPSFNLGWKNSLVRIRRCFNLLSPHQGLLITRLRYGTRPLYQICSLRGWMDWIDYCWWDRYHWRCTTDRIDSFAMIRLFYIWPQTNVFTLRYAILLFCVESRSTRLSVDEDSSCDSDESNNGKLSKTLSLLTDTEQLLKVRFNILHLQLLLSRKPALLQKRCQKADERTQRKHYLKMWSLRWKYMPIPTS
jgi:hypothetical protein